MEIIALMLLPILFIGFFISASFLWKFKKDDFLASEADRCLNKFCEIDENWNSRGRVYTKGLALIEENGKRRFIKQAKLCDIGILK